MNTHRKGIHHITVLSGEPEVNADFYVNTLGMRLVKKSVNQDDPGTYHLFYGNASASPGSSLTFFPWPGATKAKPGSGEAAVVSFMVPQPSKDYWQERLKEHEVPHEDTVEDFGLTKLPFEDPDGLSLELVFDGAETDINTSWKGSVPPRHRIRGFWGTTLQLTEKESTEKILTSVLGFRKADSKGSRTLYTSDAAIGNHVIIESVSPKQGKSGRGTVHHVAFRAKEEEELNELRWQVARLGLSPTKIIDRHWFKSVYFQSPGGVLFEMATDGPGYDVDEDPERLGEKLILPPWLESRREQIEQRLPELRI